MSQGQRERSEALPRTTGLELFAAEMGSEPNRVIVTARGRFDLRSQPELALTLAKATAAGGGEVVVDLKDLDSIVPGCVRTVLLARSLLDARGRRVVVQPSNDDPDGLASRALADPPLR